MGAFIFIQTDAETHESSEVHVSVRHGQFFFFFTSDKEEIRPGYKLFKKTNVGVA